MSPSELTRDLLCRYVAHTLKDEQLCRRIDEERAVAGSWVQRTLEEMYAKLSDPLNVDWRALLCVDPPLDRPPITDLERALDQDDSLNEGDEALGFDDYWEMETFQLATELSEYDYDEALAVHRGSGHPLEPYRALIRQFITQAWKWPEKRLLPEYTDAVQTARSLAAAIESANLGLPFPPGIVAIVLVKSGLDSWCR